MFLSKSGKLPNEAVQTMHMLRLAWCFAHAAPVEAFTLPTRQEPLGDAHVGATAVQDAYAAEPGARCPTVCRLRRCHL